MIYLSPPHWKFSLSDTRRKVCFYPADFFWPRSYTTITSTRPVYLIVQMFLRRRKNTIKTLLSLTQNMGVPMIGHLFQNYDTIYVRFFPTYTCNHSCYTIYVRFFVTYTCVLFPSIWPFSYKRAYMRTKKPIYMPYEQTCVYGVIAGSRIRGIELYRRQ